MSYKDHESDEDSAPESVSFESGKMENAEQNQKIKEQINSIRESQKLRRIERQEKYIEQKVFFLNVNKSFDFKLIHFRKKNLKK